MSERARVKKLALSCLSLWLAVFSAVAAPASVSWDAQRQTFSADLQGASLESVLESVARQTGWRVYMEPDDSVSVTTSFTGMKVGHALDILLGDMSFALVPKLNEPSKLFVFRNSKADATKLIEVSKKPLARRVPNEIIIKVAEGTDVEALAKSLGATITGAFPEHNLYRLKFADEESTAKARDALASNSSVEGVADNYYVDRPTPSQPIPSSPLRPIGLTFQPPPEDGQVVVGLIDTAVQPLGDELEPFIKSRLSVFGEDASTTTTTEPMHGTSMAQTLLRGVEVASEGHSSIQIIAVDVYGPNGESSSWDVAQGVLRAANEGADIINLSLGGYGGDPLLGGLLQDLTANEIPIFAAAGNDGVADPFYPAADPGVIAVTAVEHGHLAPYANYGDFVDIAAPGRSVVYHNGQPFYVSGTSGATAYASGLAASAAEGFNGNAAQGAQEVVSQLSIKPPAGQ